MGSSGSDTESRGPCLGFRLKRQQPTDGWDDLSVAAGLLAALEVFDLALAGHCVVVATYAGDVAAQIGQGDEVQQLVHTAGLVHDIGKLGVPKAILWKPGALSAEESLACQRHVLDGERILARVPEFTATARTVRHQAERFDGSGFPDGLKGKDIPLASRIIAVADYYSVMTMDTPSRDAMPSRLARLRVAQAAEAQFDPAAAAALDVVLTQADEPYRLGTGPRFVFRGASE